VARPGVAWRWQGKVFWPIQWEFQSTGPGGAWPGVAWRWQGKVFWPIQWEFQSTWPGSARPGMARLGQAGQGKVLLMGWMRIVIDTAGPGTVFNKEEK
jgi:hypothetical protein